MANCWNDHDQNKEQLILQEICEFLLTEYTLISQDAVCKPELCPEQEVDDWQTLIW